MFFPMYCFTMPVNSNGVSTLGRAHYEALQGVVELMTYYTTVAHSVECPVFPGQND